MPGRRGWLRLVLVQTVAGPLAGDSAPIEVEVGEGAALELVGNGATVAMPCAEPARQDVRIRIGRGGRFAWLPEPLVLTAGCDFEASLDLELEEGAAALTREQVVLGRFGEVPGRYRSRVRCELGGRPLLHDEIRIDGREQASAAVLDGAGAFGSLALLGLDAGGDRRSGGASAGGAWPSAAGARAGGGNVAGTDGRSRGGVARSVGKRTIGDRLKPAHTAATLGALRDGGQGELRHLVALGQDRLALGAGDREPVSAPDVQDELAAHRAGEADTAGERDQLLVERAGEGDDLIAHRRLRNTPTTLPMTST